MAEPKVFGAIVNSGEVVKNLMYTQPLTDVNEWNSFSQLSYQRRIGQEAILKRIEIHFSFSNVPVTIPSAAPANVTYVRTLLLQSGTRETDGAPAGAQAMWMGDDFTRVQYNSIANRLQCLYYKIDPAFYRTIYDKVWVVGLQGNGINTVTGSIKKSFNKKITFSGNSEGTNQQSAMFYFVHFAYSPAEGNITIGNFFRREFGYKTKWVDF